MTFLELVEQQRAEIQGWPDFLIIERANEVQSVDGGYTSTFTDDCDAELESRIPIFEKEYDSEGNLIVSELMGYTDEGEEIWS